jgi:hypothetical protein
MTHLKTLLITGLLLAAQLAPTSSLAAAEGPLDYLYRMQFSTIAGTANLSAIRKFLDAHKSIKRQQALGPEQDITVVEQGLWSCLNSGRCSLEAVQYFVGEGARVNKDYFTGTHVYTLVNSIQLYHGKGGATMMKAMDDSQAQIRKMDPKHPKAPGFTTREEKVQILEWMLARGAALDSPKNMAPLAEAALLAGDDVFRRLLKAGMDPGLAVAKIEKDLADAQARLDLLAEFGYQ